VISHLTALFFHLLRVALPDLNLELWGHRDFSPEVGENRVMWLAPLRVPPPFSHLPLGSPFVTQRIVLVGLEYSSFGLRIASSGDLAAARVGGAAVSVVGWGRQSPSRWMTSVWHGSYGCSAWGRLSPCRRSLIERSPCDPRYLGAMAVRSISKGLH
jgi:hypothetical protein